MHLKMKAFKKCPFFFLLQPCVPDLLKQINIDVTYQTPVQHLINSFGFDMVLDKIEKWVLRYNSSINFTVGLINNCHLGERHFMPLGFLFSFIIFFCGLNRETFIKFLSDLILAREAKVLGDIIVMQAFCPTALTCRSTLQRILIIYEILNLQQKDKLEKYNLGHLAKHISDCMYFQHNNS